MRFSNCSYGEREKMVNDSVENFASAEHCNSYSDFFEKSLDDFLMSKNEEIAHEIEILKEVNNFRETNDDAEVRMVQDELMLPLYAPGDYVGGFKLIKSDFHHALDNHCIIETKTGEILIRTLEKANDSENFVFNSFNHNTQSKTNFSASKIQSIIPIVWHRKMHNC